MSVNLIIALCGWLTAWILAATAAKRTPVGKTTSVSDLSAYRPATEAADMPEISVVIPARNEAKRLPILLKSLTHAAPDSHWQVLVADDHSTDETAAVARANQADVVTVPPLPEGWFGKSFALWHGAQAAQKEWLVFLDADLDVDPHAIVEIVKGLSPRQACTVQPWHRVERLYEQLSMYLNILVWLGVSASAKRGGGGFGPVLIVHRDAYFRAGGHAGIQNELLEHFRFSASLEASGIPVVNLIGRKNLNFRMHDEGIWHLISGWQKHFAHGTRATQPWRLVAAILWICGSGAAFTTLLHACSQPSHVGLGLALLVYVAFALQTMTLARRVGRFAWWAAVCYPLFLLFFLLVFLTSLVTRRSQTQWKGRSLDNRRQRDGV